MQYHKTRELTGTVNHTTPTEKMKMFSVTSREDLASQILQARTFSNFSFNISKKHYEHLQICKL